MGWVWFVPESLACDSAWADTILTGRRSSRNAEGSAYISNVEPKTLDRSKYRDAGVDTQKVVSDSLDILLVEDNLEYASYSRSSCGALSLPGCS